MPIAHKPFATLAVLAGLAMTPSAVSAQVHVIDEPDGVECDKTVVFPDHFIAGNCHWEVRSEGRIGLVLQTAGGPVALSSCRVRIEAMAGGDGKGYVLLARTPSSRDSRCTRKQCDEGDNGMDKPSPLQITEHGAGDERIAVAFCLEPRPDSDTETTCEVSLPLSGGADHEYVTGKASQRCEGEPPLWIEDVELVDDEDSRQEVEIVH